GERGVGRVRDRFRECKIPLISQRLRARRGSAEGNVASFRYSLGRRVRDDRWWNGRLRNNNLCGHDSVSGIDGKDSPAADVRSAHNIAVGRARRWEGDGANQHRRGWSGNIINQQIMRRSGPVAGLDGSQEPVGDVNADSYRG